jgi:hypothetical protein
VTLEYTYKVVVKVVFGRHRQIACERAWMLHVGTRCCAPSDWGSKMAKWKQQMGWMQCPVRSVTRGPVSLSGLDPYPSESPLGPFPSHE